MGVLLSLAWSVVVLRGCIVNWSQLCLMSALWEWTVRVSSTRVGRRFGLGVSAAGGSAVALICGGRWVGLADPGDETTVPSFVVHASWESSARDDLRRHAHVVAKMAGVPFEALTRAAERLCPIELHLEQLTQISAAVTSRKADGKPVREELQTWELGGAYWLRRM